MADPVTVVLSGLERHLGILGPLNGDRPDQPVMAVDELCALWIGRAPRFGAVADHFTFSWWARWFRAGFWGELRFPLDLACSAAVDSASPGERRWSFWAPEVLLFGDLYLGWRFPLRGVTREQIDWLCSAQVRGSAGPRLPFWSPELPEVLVAYDVPEGGSPRQRPLRAIVTALLLLLVLALPAGAQTLHGPARVIDGDTLEVAGEKIRMYGIDAPEKEQVCQRASGATWHCGWAAALRLEELIAGRPVRCLGTKRDRYKRIIARCYVWGERPSGASTTAGEGPVLDLGGALVVRGLATAYRKYSLDYASAEATAKAARAGMWSGSFVPPAEWRKGVRQ